MKCQQISLSTNQIRAFSVTRHAETGFEKTPCRMRRPTRARWRRPTRRPAGSRRGSAQQGHSEQALDRYRIMTYLECECLTRRGDDDDDAEEEEEGEEKEEEEGEEKEEEEEEEEGECGRRRA